jgi:hypothetical protein
LVVEKNSGGDDDGVGWNGYGKRLSLVQDQHYHVKRCQMKRSWGNLTGHVMHVLY